VGAFLLWRYDTQSTQRIQDTIRQNARDKDGYMKREKNYDICAVEIALIAGT
jgi:hypothetical protein